jgi:hypothetical protein
MDQALRATHRAFLVPLKPDSGSERDNYYLYDVVFSGETIVSDSRVPEFDACRVSRAGGFEILGGPGRAAKCHRFFHGSRPPLRTNQKPNIVI